MEEQIILQKLKIEDFNNTKKMKSNPILIIFQKIKK